MRGIIRMSVAVLFVSLSWMAIAGSNERSVRIGGEADYDACGSTGEVRGLNASGDNFLAVRSGPGSKFAMIDKIHTGDPVYICDQHGRWIGIVYTSGDRDCGVSSPVARRQPYSGGCQSGWVHQKYIKLVAG